MDSCWECAARTDMDQALESRNGPDDACWKELELPCTRTCRAFSSLEPGAQTPSAASPEGSTCEALGTEQPQERYSLSARYLRVFHTKAAHSWLWFLKVCGEVPHFSLAPAGRQPLAPSVEEQLKVCMPWVPAASCWVYLQTIRKAQNQHLHAKTSALPWHIPFFKDPFNSFHDGPHFCHGTSACRARAKPHCEIQGGGNLKKACGA